MSSVATSSKVTLSPKVTPAQQCSTCGYQWPWVVSTTILYIRTSMWVSIIIEQHTM